MFSVIIPAEYQDKIEAVRAAVERETQTNPNYSPDFEVITGEHINIDGLGWYDGLALMGTIYRALEVTDLGYKPGELESMVDGLPPLDLDDED